MSRISIKGISLSTMVKGGRDTAPYKIINSINTGLPGGEDPGLVWEQPTTTGITIGGNDLSTYYKANYDEYNESKSDIPIPPGVTGLKVFCIGGSGGGSGGNGAYQGSSPGGKNARFQNDPIWNDEGWRWADFVWNFIERSISQPGYWEGGNDKPDILKPVVGGNKGAAGNYGTYISKEFNVTGVGTFSVFIGNGGTGGVGGLFIQQKEATVGGAGASGNKGGETKFTLGNESLISVGGSGGEGKTNNQATDATKSAYSAPAAMPSPSATITSGSGGEATNGQGGSGTNGGKGCCRVYYLYPSGIG